MNELFTRIVNGEKWRDDGYRVSYDGATGVIHHLSDKCHVRLRGKEATELLPVLQMLYVQRPFIVTRSFGKLDLSYSVTFFVFLHPLHPSLEIGMYVEKTKPGGKKPPALFLLPRHIRFSLGMPRDIKKEEESEPE